MLNLQGKKAKNLRKNMISSKRTIKSMTALFVGMAFVFIGNALIVSSVGVILKQISVGEVFIGLIGSCFFVGAMISTISSHRIISKVGHIRAFGLFSAGFSICIILHNLSENLYFWAFLRLVMGACYYGILIIIESWLNEKAKNAVRQRVLSFYEVVFYSSFGLGTLIIAFDLPSEQLFVIAACFIMFSSIPLNLIRIKEPLIPAKSPISLPKIFTIAPLALLTSFIGGMLMNGFFSMASLFVLLQGYGAAEVSYFIFFGILGGFIAQSLIGFVSDRLGRKFSIILCACVALASMLVYVIFTPSLAWQFAIALFLGMGIFCLYALALARANDMLEDKSKRVELGRAVLFCYSLGSLLAPLTLGVVMQTLNYKGFAYFYILALAFLILFALNKPNKKGIYERNLKTGLHDD